MTINNLCNSCTNIGCEFQSGIIRTKCAFYMPPHIEPDNCGNYVVMRPPKEGLRDTSGEKELAINEEEYISKSDYEARLKADMIAILTEIKDEASNIIPTIYNCGSFTEGIRTYDKLVQQKINALKENKE